MLRTFVAVVALGYVLLPSLATAEAGSVTREQALQLVGAGRNGSGALNAVITRSKALQGNPIVVNLGKAVQTRGTIAMSEVEFGNLADQINNFEGDNLVVAVTNLLNSGKALEVGALGKEASSVKLNAAAPVARQVLGTTTVTRGTAETITSKVYVGKSRSADPKDVQGVRVYEELRPLATTYAQGCPVEARAECEANLLAGLDNELAQGLLAQDKPTSFTRKLFGEKLGVVEPVQLRQMAQGFRNATPGFGDCSRPTSKVAECGCGIAM